MDITRRADTCYRAVPLRTSNLFERFDEAPRIRVLSRGSQRKEARSRALPDHRHAHKHNTDHLQFTGWHGPTLLGEFPDHLMIPRKFIANPLIVQGRGGAGNHLFQYAAALSLAAQIDDPEIFYIPSDDPLRHAGLAIEDFLGPLPRPRFSDLARFLMPPCGLDPRITRTNRAVRRVLRIGRTLWRQQRGKRLQTIEVPYIGKGILINAFCQSLDWVGSALPEISEKILTRKPPTIFSARGIIALHFRLGDFRRLGWTLPTDYYFKSLTTLDPRRQCKLWIITDEADEQAKLATLFAEKGWEIQRPPVHDCRPELVRFWNLCIAEKTILSCSTFAWWAAVVGDFFHDLEGRTVAFPDPWLPLYNDNLCRPQWVKVPYSGQGI